jgi:hypothetical protein
VANPNKSYAVQKILISNREKLLRFLPTFLEDRTEDEQFVEVSLGELARTEFWAWLGSDGRIVSSLAYPGA